MLNRLLCAIGLHDWRTDYGGFIRWCPRCGAQQFRHGWFWREW